MRYPPDDRRLPSTQVRRVGPSLPVPPGLPPGYGDALRMAQRYNRSYDGLSRSMLRSYGPIPRTIPPAYLRHLAPHAPTAEDSPATSGETDRGKTLILASCIILAIVVVGAWMGSLSISPSAPQPDASKQIQRVDQLAPSQYADTTQYNLWSPSTCSAASMTEVINAYGHNYQLADILKVEADSRQITPEDGLLYGASSIDRTVSAFGFSAHALDTPSVDNVIAAANSGTPVIVGFRDPRDFPNGHILVVRGGDANQVDLVDSSRLNLQSVSRATFSYYYHGFAVVATPNGTAPQVSDYSVSGQPSVTAGFINQVLDHYHSPAAGQGQALYDDGVKYGIDPVFALAFFMNESTFGTQGMPALTLSIGNIRCLADRPCINTHGDACQSGQSCFAQFYSWEDGFDHWYQLIHDGYVQGNINKAIGRQACPCTTVAQITQIYDPGTATHYTAVVEHAVDTWRAGKVVVS